MMVELVVGTAASVVTVAGGLYSTARWLRRRNAGAALESPEEHSSTLLVKRLKDLPPLDMELVPVCYEIRLTDRVPQVEVLLRVVNYLTKTIRLEETVADCHVGSCPTFEKLQLVMGVDVPPRRSTEVVCRRPLVDSEIRFLKTSLAGNGPFDGSVQVSAKARTGKRAVSHEAGWLGARGWILGLPLATAAQPSPQSIPGESSAASQA